MIVLSTQNYYRPHMLLIIELDYFKRYGLTQAFISRLLEPIINTSVINIG